jgi:AraC-like DNA-binding protein
MAEVENTGNSFNIQNDNGDTVNMFPTTTGASSQNLYNEQVSVGNGITGPKPQTSNNRQAAEQLLNNILVNNNNTTDRYAYAKPTTFNSTHTGLNFDRYYNHPNFRKLGFSPYRDNETIYNKNSSWADDFRRASTQYGTLWSNGFSSLFKNWGSLASSTPDFEGAHTMEKAMAIGSSSKDGFGASFTNFYLNSAYTVGVLSEIAVEEIALALATVGTGSMATPVAVGRTALNVGRFSKAIGNLFKGAKNVSTARKVWNVAKKITPFGDTADLARGIIAGDRATLRGIYKTQNSLDAFAKSKALFGQFYRDTREINAASAESKLEAGMVSNQVSGDLINKFYAENGRMPNDPESKMIYDRAQRAGAETFLYNMPAIYFSNKIVLETAFKGIKPLRNIIGEVPGRLRPIIQAGKDGKKIAKVLDLDATKTYFTKDYWKNIGKGMSPKKILGAGLRYTSANITEGLQEVYQESLSAGLVDHYTNQNWGTQRIGEAGLWNSLKIGAKELDRNNMALETFLSGFFMAAPIGGIQTIAFKKAPQLLQRIAKPQEYKQQQDARQKSINALENALTDLVNDPTKWANDFHANATKQNQLAMEGLEAEQAGDVKAAKDFQEESIFNHMYTMLQHNMMGEFKDQMKDLLTLNDTELQEAFGGNKGTNNADTYNSDLRSRINKSIASSEKLEERYKKANDTFFNPFNKQNADEFIDWYGFEEAKKLYVFNEHMFDQTVDRAQSIFDNLSANPKVSKLVAGNISSILDTRAGGQLDQLINLLKQEITTYEGGTKEDIKLAEEKKKQLEGLEEWKNAAIAYEQAYDSMTMAGLDPEQATRYVEEAKRFPRGATVEYTNQKGEKVQGKVVSKAGTNLILEIINKAGRKQRVAIKVEKATVVGQLTLDFDAKDLEGQDMVDALEYLFQALFGKMEGMGTKGVEGPGGYMQTLAGVDGLNMTREEMAQVFNNIMDYFRLKKDSMTHLNAINRLADPGFFANSAERISTAQKAAKRIAELKIKVMLADFEKIQDRHILLQELFELGVFLDPKDVDGLINDKKIPSSFYTATNVDGIPELTFIDPLNKDHQPLYKKIIDVLEAYETKEGVAFTDKVDVNIFQQALSGQLGQVYRKTKNDSRTIKDLAKEYGFNVDETSEVDVKELFQKIIDSDYGRTHDKVLARRLLATIPEGFKIKFDRNHGVGVSYDSTNGVIVNPNFSAENYQGGQVALESLILNGVMQKLVADNLSNKEFKTAIEKIKAQVAEALANGQLDEIIAELKSKYDIVFTDSSGKVVVNNIAGMRSLEQFVAMAMTDPAFQSLLGNVTVEETQKTLWEQFLDAVKSLVQTLTGMAPGTTALEETINLTTAALTGSNITTTTEETPVATKPTVATPLNSMPEELRTALQTAWSALSQEDKSGYTDISEWVKGSSAAAGMINKYNKQKEQKEAETRTEEELKLAALTPQQLSYLRNKSGLNDKDIFAMDINDLVEIASSKFRILNEGEKLTASQVSQGIVVKEFNGIKMTNSTVVSPAFTEDPIIAQKLTQVGSALEQLLANALGRGNNKKVTLLDNAAKSLAEQIIGQIKAIYNIKDLEFTEEMGSKIRLLLSDKSTFFFRVTSLNDIVEDIRNSSKAELPQKLSEAIENLLTKGPATEQMKAGADRGLVFDEFFRLTLQGTLNAVIDDAYVTNFLNQALKNTKQTLNISQEIILTPAAIVELRQTLEHIVTYMKENNLRALTSTNELFGNIGVMPVSGQVDIIMYNDKGELFILDMKTMSSSLDRAQMEGYGREITGKTKDDRFGYASKDTAQLNIYRELIQALVGAELQKAGMQIKGLGIIPLLVTGSLNNSNELIIRSIKLSDPIREDSAGTRGLYIPVLEKTTIELFPELYAQAPPAQPPVSADAVRADIEKLENQLEITKATIPVNKKGIDSLEKQIAEKKEQLAALGQSTATAIPTDAKADIERRQGLNGVEEIIFSNPNFKLEGFEIDGNYWNVVTSTDRAKVLVNINGVIVPFYLTTGQAGKGLVPGWYPFFGIGKDGWLNKTDKSDMETYYERYWGEEAANIAKSISEELNSFYGTDPSTFKNDGDPNATSRPLSTLADKVEDYINSKLSYTPAINNADARKTLRSNVEQLGKEINAKYDAELAALGQQTPTSTSVINQEILNEYAGQVIYVSPGIKISEELANDPNVILYDDFIIGILNQHLGVLGVAEITRETLFATLAEIYSSTNKAAKNKLTQLLNNDVYNAAINELAENPEKILITQSNIFTKEAGSNVAVAIVPESLESYDNKSLALLEQKEFRKNSRIRTTKSTDLQEVLKNPLTKLDKQRDLTARGESATYEEFVKQAEFDSLILLVTELDTMEDGDFIFEKEVDGALRDQKNYLYTLIKTELQKRMKDGIITSNELLQVAKEGDIVIMENTELYARGLGVVTKKGNIKAIYYNESASDDFKQFGLPPSESNKVIGVEQLAEILEEEETTENENFQAAENNKTINQTVTKEAKVKAVEDATSANEEADKIDWC